jgi:hypothetical protein
MSVKVLKKGTTFSIETSSVLKYILNKKIGNLKSIFDFRKLNKIYTGGIKIQKFAWRGMKSSLEHFSCWKLLPICH